MKFVKLQVVNIKEQATIDDQLARVRDALHFHMGVLVDAYRPTRSVHKDCIDEIMIEFPIEFLTVMQSCKEARLQEALDNTVRAAHSRVRRIPITILD